MGSTTSKKFADPFKEAPRPPSTLYRLAVKLCGDSVTHQLFRISEVTSGPLKGKLGKFKMFPASSADNEHGCTIREFRKPNDDEAKAEAARIVAAYAKGEKV
jgi:hypothetical protein